MLLTAPFPEFTGRVCPQLCEKACMLGDDAATNRDNELYIIEEASATGWIAPRVPRAARTGAWPWWAAARRDWRRRTY